MSIIIDKPWGRELILTDKNLPYVVKILEIKSGQRLSLQYHDQKTETLTLVSGEVQLLLEDQTINMEKLVGYTIKFGTKHRLTAISDSQVYEASTPEIGTTFRLEDDYQRL
jgi:quercetin dioxygenase-like cupin family protein